MSVRIGPDRELRVARTIPCSPTITTLIFEEQKDFTHVPGQYVTVYFSDSHTQEGKAYSLANAPYESPIITVRAMGEFSNRIARMRPGETLAVSNPYGFFSPEVSEEPLTLIAGGIGITPFRSIILDLAATESKRRVALYHSARTNDDCIYQAELEIALHALPGLQITRFVTRETPGPDARAGRISTHDVCASAGVGDTMLCGSTSFVRDFWHSLRESGIPANRIYTESFFQQ